ncbi:hypothetical protein [Bradyrhizobium brasilense]|uniref:hypothetical protein n=1 Tax=Bradyrhizobium brasilense TaxID=1419277 RepID=UPI001E4FDDCD|nr:hypothetical protein [Bradyrhizobium brasilense]MCC8969131.1 hypothetical protein [Bradyrhizobium brasilense]
MNFSQLRSVGAAFASFPAGPEKGRENRISSELATGSRELGLHKRSFDFDRGD